MCDTQKIWVWPDQFHYQQVSHVKPADHLKSVEYIISRDFEKLEREHKELQAKAEAREAVLRASLVELIAAADPFVRATRLQAPLELPESLPVRNFIPGAWPLMADAKRQVAAVALAQSVLSQTSPRAEALLRLVAIARELDTSAPDAVLFDLADRVEQALRDYDQAKDKT